MRERWGLRRRWHLYAGSLAALVALLSTLLLVGRGHAPRDVLVAEEPTPTATTSSAEIPGPSGTPAPTDEPSPAVSATPNPVETTKPTASPETPQLQLDEDHLLSDAYVSTAFGGGRTPFVGTSDGGAASACTLLVAGAAPTVRLSVARIWSWPGETVVGETFARAPSVEEASDALRTCRSPDLAWGNPGRPLELDLGDESFLWRSDGALADEVMAGVRIGRELLLLVWRQSGGIGSTEPLSRAAVHALAVAGGREEGAPLVAEHREAPSKLRGFLGYDDLRPIMAPRGSSWDLTSWDTDRDDLWAFQCAEAEGTWMHPAGPMVSRYFQGGVLNATDSSSVGLTLADDADEATATGRFAACRDAAYGSPVADLGDEAFEALTQVTNDGSEHAVVVRVGRRFVILTAYNEGHWVEMARAAVAALESAGRLG